MTPRGTPTPAPIAIALLDDCEGGDGVALGLCVAVFGGGDALLDVVVLVVVVTADKLVVASALVDVLDGEVVVVEVTRGLKTKVGVPRRV
jgi:hypothetical protein